jgi:putative phosphoesterase
LLIAVVADTHMPRGRRALPARVIETMSSADLIIHAGDIMTAEVLSEIQALGPPVVAVHGNMDSEELRRRLPAERLVAVKDASIGIVHDAGTASGRFDRLRRRFPEADAVVFGHSHLPLHEQKGSFQIFNPGSPTERRRAPLCSLGIARLRRGRLTFEHVWLDDHPSG